MTDPMQFMREEFDKIDKKLVDLLEQRFELSEKIGVYKKGMNIAIEDVTREGQVLQNIAGMTTARCSDNIVTIYQSILDESKKVQLAIESE